MSYNESQNRNSNYPRMSQSEWDNAPFNQHDNKKPKDFPCHVSVTLERNVHVPTSLYNELYEKNEDGECIQELCTEEVNWESEYKENCFTIPDMLLELKGYVEHDLSVSGTNTSKGKYLSRLLEACQGWAEYETCVEEL